MANTTAAGQSASKTSDSSTTTSTGTSRMRKTVRRFGRVGSNTRALVLLVALRAEDAQLLGRRERVVLARPLVLHQRDAVAARVADALHIHGHDRPARLVDGKMFEVRGRGLEPRLVPEQDAAGPVEADDP